jgi:hypothetical protein
MQMFTYASSCVNLYTSAQGCTGLVFGKRSIDDAVACVQNIEYVDLNGSGNEVEYRVTDANASRSGWALNVPNVVLA